MKKLFHYLFFVFGFSLLFASSALAVPVKIQIPRESVGDVDGYANIGTSQKHWVAFYVTDENGENDRQIDCIKGADQGGKDVGAYYDTSRSYYYLNYYSKDQVDLRNCNPSSDLKNGQKIRFDLYRLKPDNTGEIIAQSEYITVSDDNRDLITFTKANMKDAKPFVPDELEEEWARQARRTEAARVPGVVPADPTIDAPNSGGGYQGAELKVPDYQVAGWHYGCGTVTTSNPQTGTSTTSTKVKEIETALGCIKASPIGIAEAVLNIAISVAGGLAFLLMVYGSFLMIVSGGDPKGLDHGRTVLTSAIAGLLIIIFSVFILRFFGLSILKLPAFTNLNNGGGGSSSSVNTNLNNARPAQSPGN